MLSRLKRKGQSGQSLVILAIGFLALLGFVGIVTDVSVLFIRYSTMRRAVDAAAIAAAGQMRRIQDTILKPDGSVLTADGQATSIANLNLAARQFIEVYGLNPKSVIVETCRTQQIARNSAGDPLDAAGVKLYIQVPDPPPVGKTKTERNPAADQATIDRYEQLCTKDELKLVRVTTQIDAPTIFLRLLGYPTVTLTESAISQTAVIDVVLIFDVSESMLNETTYDDWDTLTPKQGVRYMPPYVSFQDLDYGWPYINANNQTQLNAETRPDPTGTLPVSTNIWDRTVAFECTAPRAGGGCDAANWTQFSGNTFPNTTVNAYGRVAPREFCQVRAYPGSVIQGDTPPAWLRQEYWDFFNGAYSSGGTDVTRNYTAQFNPSPSVTQEDPNQNASSVSQTVSYMGFVPQYNYYGCCNDPDGDWSFRDLVCQPFKQARDAAGQFLNRLDFLRGDRVAFVTFDRRATVIDPDGESIVDPNLDGNLSDSIVGGDQAHMIETQTDIYDSSSKLIRKGADNTLEDVIGVRAEISSYADIGTDGVTANGVWDHLRDHTNAVDYNYFMNAPIGDLFDHPVNGACPFTEAIIPAYFLSNARQQMDLMVPPTMRGYHQELLREVMTVPNWYYATGGNVDLAIYRNYEYRASCAGTNIGEALQAGSGALYNEARREGAVWIMVLLSDGAAGASNPITKYQNGSILPADPFYRAGTIIVPQPGQGGPNTTPFVAGNGGYGAFGVCPYGTQAQPSQLVSNQGTDFFPSCSDLDPATRHFCGTVSVTPNTALEQDPDCFNYYNVDDYARDWADWVGVAELPGSDVSGNTGRISSQLLPTIFTIGFGLNFDDGVCGTAVLQSTWDCQRGINQTVPAGMTDPKLIKAWRIGMRTRNADYLGEELLRYIADVGDNNQIDSDYWQTCLSGAQSTGQQPPCRDDLANADPTDPERIDNEIDITSTSPDWGARGACQQIGFSAGGGLFERGWKLDPLPPRQACGNYYVAATQQELEDVFNQIASRMFTRLSQ